MQHTYIERLASGLLGLSGYQNLQLTRTYNPNFISFTREYNYGYWETAYNTHNLPIVCLTTEL